MTFDYRESGGGYLARLEYSEQRIETIPRVGEKVGEKLTENQRKILRCMEENPKVSAGAIAEKVGISIRKVEENIRKLREMKFIKRIGSARGGHWEVLNNE